MEYTGTATGTTVQYWDIMNCVCLCQARVARTSVVLCDNMHSCQLLTNPDWDTVFSSSAIFNDFKSACLRGLSLHVQTIFFDFAQILQVSYLWSQICLEQRHFSRSLRSPPYQHASPKWPKKSSHIWPRKQVLPHRTRMEIQTKRDHFNIYSP